MHTKIEAAAGVGGGSIGATAAFGVLGFMWSSPYQQKTMSPNSSNMQHSNLSMASAAQNQWCWDSWHWRHWWGWKNWCRNSFPGFMWLWKFARREDNPKDCNRIQKILNMPKCKQRSKVQLCMAFPEVLLPLAQLASVHTCMFHLMLNAPIWELQPHVTSKNAS